MPDTTTLQSPTRLRHSAWVASVGVALILVAVVRPVEYGIDSSAAGRVLELTEMGEIEQELAVEAEQDKLECGDDQEPRCSRR